MPDALLLVLPRTQERPARIQISEHQKSVIVATQARCSARNLYSEMLDVLYLYLTFVCPVTPAMLAVLYRQINTTITDRVE